MHKKHYSVVCALMILTMILHAHQKLEDQLSELCITESEFVLNVDEGIRAICRMLTQEWLSQNLCFKNDDLAELLNPATQEIDVETALRALDFCIHTELNTHSKQEQSMRETLAEIYAEINEKYNAIIAQSCSRKIKINFCTTD